MNYENMNFMHQAFYEHEVFPNINNSNELGYMNSNTGNTLWTLHELGQKLKAFDTLACWCSI